MDNFSEWLHWNVYSNMTWSCPFNLYVGLLHHFRHSEWFRIKDEKRLELTLSVSGQIQLTFIQYDDNFFEQTRMVFVEKWHWKSFEFFQGQNLLLERCNKGSVGRPEMTVSKILRTTRSLLRMHQNVNTRCHIRIVRWKRLI